MSVRARDINDAMLIAAANAIADMIQPQELTAEYVIPSPFNEKAAKAVAQAVSKAARESGTARI